MGTEFKTAVEIRVRTRVGTDVALNEGRFIIRNIVRSFPSMEMKKPRFFSQLCGKDRANFRLAPVKTFMHKLTSGLTSLIYVLRGPYAPHNDIEKFYYM